LGELLARRTAYAREALAAVPGVSLLHDQPAVREFAIELDVPVSAVIRRCQKAGVNPGYELGRDYPEYSNGLLVALTERRSREEIDLLASVLGEAIAAEKAGTEVVA
jgi:glycine dehydrogenase subunit 1